MENLVKKTCFENPRSRSNRFLVHAKKKHQFDPFFFRVTNMSQHFIRNVSPKPQPQAPNPEWNEFSEACNCENGGNSPISWVLLWEARIFWVDSLPESIRCLFIAQNGDLLHEIYVAKSSNRISIMTTAALLRWKNVIQTLYPRNSTWKTSQMEWASAFPTDSKKNVELISLDHTTRLLTLLYEVYPKKHIWIRFKTLMKFHHSTDWFMVGFLSWPVVIPI